MTETPTHKFACLIYADGYYGEPVPCPWKMDASMFEKDMGKVQLIPGEATFVCEHDAIGIAFLNGGQIIGRVRFQDMVGPSVIPKSSTIEIGPEQKRLIF